MRSDVVGTPPVRWPSADEPLPAIQVPVPEGDTLHRVVGCQALQILIDSGMGMRPSVVLLRLALCVVRDTGREPEA